MAKTKRSKILDKVVLEMQQTAAAERSMPAKRKREKQTDDFDYSILWNNFSYVQERWNLSEDETYNCLLAVLGPSPESEAFDKKRKMRDAAATAEAADAAPSAPSAPSAPMTSGPVSDDGLDQDTLMGIIQEAEEGEESEEEATDGDVDPEQPVPATVPDSQTLDFADVGAGSEERVPVRFLVLWLPH